MKCPSCGSANVVEMVMQSPEWQMRCLDCNNVGKYHDFDIQCDRNVGLATTPEGSLYRIEENFNDAADPDRTLAITIHVVDGHTVANTWMRKYGQWIKLKPERTINSAPSLLALNGEIVRLLLDESIKQLLKNDIRWRYVLESLQLEIGRLSKK